MNTDWAGTAMETLGISVAQCDKKQVVCTMKVDERHVQPFGIMHGGMSGVLAETAASQGSTLYVDLFKQSVVGMELNMNHLRSARPGEILQAVAIPVHVGRTTLVWEIKIYNEKEKLICISRCTVAIVNRPALDANQ